MEWLLRAERLQLADKLVNIAVDDVGQRCRVSVLRDWLEGLKWDGTARIETWLATYIGAADTPYHRAVGKWWLISAVARGVKPGCKADHAIVLEGGQGIGKSSALRTLAGEDWFSDTAADLSTKDAMQDLPGNWIIELGELAALRRTSDIQAVKFFLSKCDDKYRPSYGRRSVRVPRQCVFAGTINDDEYLMDETGNRRFWPVRCGTIDLEGLARDRDQLWAEAVALYRAGERWWPLRGEEAMCATEQERRTTDPTDPWLQPIAEWIQANAIRETTIWDVLERCLKVGGLSCGKREQMRVGKCLKALGFMRALSGPERVTKWSN
jgi:putative DNA primase/helicase